MASLSTTNFKSSKNTAFANNTTGLITEEVMRNQFENIADSFFNKESDAFTAARGTFPGVSNITDLKAIATVSVTVGTIVNFRDTSSADLLRVYQLVSGTTTESSPDFIRPNDYAGTTNEKIWRLLKIIPRYTRPNIDTIAGLKGILTASVSGLENGTYISFADSDASNVLRTYKLTAGTTAESSPDVIRPNDYAGTTNEKVWVLVASSGSVDLSSKADAKITFKDHVGDHTLDADDLTDVNAGKSVILRGDGTSDLTVVNEAIQDFDEGTVIGIQDFVNVVEDTSVTVTPTSGSLAIQAGSVAYLIKVGSDTWELNNGAATTGGGTWGSITGTLSDQTDLQTALNAKAPLASPTFTGTPAAPTAAAGTNTTQIATTAFVTGAVNDLVGAAPGALNTLSELADALADDAAFSTTVTNALATKETIVNTQNSSSTWAVASGTDTYAATLTPAITAYATGQRFTIQFTNASTSTTPTININTLGAKTIVKRNNTALASGDIAAGQIYTIVYDGTNFRLMGIANTGVLNDVLATNQAASAATKNPAHFDDTGKLNKTSFVEVDTTNKKITQNGSDDSDATVQHEWKNLSGTWIMRVLNGLKVAFNGSASFLEVQSGATSGNAGIIALTAQDIAYRIKDSGSFDYFRVKSSTGGYGRATIITQKMVLDAGVGFEGIEWQAKLTLPNTTAATAHIVASISVPSGYGLSITTVLTHARATNGNAATCVPFVAVGENTGGTTAGTSSSVTNVYRTATTGGFSVVWNNTTDTADLTFTNETGTGRQYDVLWQFKYILYPIPV